jgi:hypothetical protein
MNESNFYIVEAYNKGYRVIKGQVYNPKGMVLSLRETDSGYLDFGYYRKGKGKIRLRIHRLVAYQKYGIDMFKEGIECRHSDGDSRNNTDDNVLIGSHSQNMMDRPKKVRLAQSLIACEAAKEKTIKYSNEEVEKIKEMYNETKSYKKVMEAFSITSKGTLHYIINK